MLQITEICFQCYLLSDSSVHISRLKFEISFGLEHHIKSTLTIKLYNLLISLFTNHYLFDIKDLRTENRRCHEKRASIYHSKSHH